MNLVRTSAMFLALAVLAISGCAKPADNGAGDGGVGGGDSNATTASIDGATTMPVALATLCGKCGEVKGSDNCCAAGAETCSGCGLHAGAPLRCAHLPEDAAGKDICQACGHVAEEGHACDSDCEKCADCGMHKGAPACCKVKS